MFLKQSYSIGFVIRNESFPHLSSWIYSNYWLCLTKYTTHYLCVYQINFYIVIYMIKNSKIKKLYLLVSKFSFEHAIFSNFPSLFFTAFFWIPICFFFEHYFIPILKTTSFTHISIVSLFPLIIFSFAEDCSISNFHKIMSKDNVENNFNNPFKNSNKISNQKKKKNESKKKTFTSNGV